MRLYFRGLIVVLCTLGCGLAATAGVALAAAPVIGEQSALEVSGTGATLQAQVDPEGSETSYRFEYDTSEYVSPAAHGQSAPSREGTVAGGASPVSVEAHIQNLTPGTVYHFRVVATNEAHEVAYGGDESFTTPVTGGEFALPDGRDWEMVTPVDKYGARVEAITNEGGVIQAAEDGSAFTYVTSSPPVTNPEGNVAIAESQIMATHGSDGWATRDITTPHEEAVYGPPLGHLAEYKIFSSDLSRGLVEPENDRGDGKTSLSPQAPEAKTYLREGLLEGVGAHYVPLVDDSNAPPGEFEGASSNLEHVILGGDEWTAGVVTPAFILPSGEQGGGLGYDAGVNARNAVSSDGRRVFFEATTNEGHLSNGNGGQKHLYMRDVAEGRTVQVDLPQGNVTPYTGSVLYGVMFQYADPEGTKVFFTDEQNLTPDAKADYATMELYEYNTLTGVLTDIAPNPAGTASTNVQPGVVQVSENGEYVYFVADGSLDGAPEGDCAGESVSEGETCDLYVAHVEPQKTSVSLVAVLSGADLHDWIVYSASRAELRQITSRVSPDGRYFAFMSERSLTGYDNRDAVSGVADEEVFVYDAVSKHLACASCDPTGARPHGVYDTQEAGEGLGLLVDRPQIWENRWLAGSIPGWTGDQKIVALYQSRYLSDEGRLFFDSADSLVPQDTNGKEDVYEYEPEGKDCGSGSVSANEAFEKGGGGGPGGCVALISSGSSSTESAFLDASAKARPGGEEGEDVFFLTASKLVSQDVDPADDVYDAHVCSTQAPCTSAPVSSPPCTTADSCRVAPAAQPTIFGAPSSATFSGAGNVLSGSSGVVVKSKTPTRMQKLVTALKACRKDRVKHKRVACEKQARKRYGALVRVKKSIKRGK